MIILFIRTRVHYPFFFREVGGNPRFNVRPKQYLTDPYFPKNTIMIAINSNDDPTESCMTMHLNDLYGTLSHSNLMYVCVSNQGLMQGNAPHRCYQTITHHL